MTKSKLEDLAVFGGRPAFEPPLHVGTPNLGERASFLARIDDILQRKWLSNQGVYVQEFERRIAEYVGVRHCIATCNATVALQIAARALDLSGEVIVPSFTFPATPHALQWQAITPRFCDIDRVTHTLDPDHVEALITPRVSAVLGVHVWGRPCAHERLAAICRAHGLRLFYDASHAFGCTHRGRFIGGLGDAEVFSFHATKFLNSGEGGAVVTNDDALALRMRRLRNFGFAGDGVEHVGTDGKMSELSAALGLTSLEKIDEFLATNQRNHRLYCEALGSIPGLRLIDYDEGEHCNFQYIVVEVEGYGLSRDELVRVLHAEGVRAKRYFSPPCHLMAPYRAANPEAMLRLPETERLSERVFALPTGTAVDAAAIATIGQLLAFLAERSGDMRRRLPRGMTAPAVLNWPPQWVSPYAAAG